MVSDDLHIFAVVDHIDVAVVVGVWVSLMGSIDLNSLIDSIACSVHGRALCRVSDQKVFRILAAIEFDQR